MMQLQFFDAGHCTHPEHVVLRNRVLRPMRFESMFAVITHPKHGVILFDTGYPIHFAELTRRLPERIYALTTPVHITPEEAAVSKLRAIGINPTDVRHIIISHFHADHVGAIGDFPAATYWFAQQAWESVRHLNRWRAVFSGFLPSLIPSDFEHRSRPILRSELTSLPAVYDPFSYGYNLFADDTLWLVELPGHATGQLGCFIEAEGAFFLVADACWTSRSFREQIVPHPITKILFEDRKHYAQTLHNLKRFSERSPEFVIAPSHCPEFHLKYCNRGPL